MVREWSLAESPIPRETVELLRTLDEYRVGLVTSSERTDVEPVLRAAQIHSRFDAMVFGGEPAEPKPSPAPYLLIAERLGVKTGIAFEDSEPGLASARAAGFRAVKIDAPGRSEKNRGGIAKVIMSNPLCKLKLFLLFAAFFFTAALSAQRPAVSPAKSPNLQSIRVSPR